MHYPACMTQRLIEAGDFYMSREGDFNEKGTSLVGSILVHSIRVLYQFPPVEYVINAV